MEEHFDVLDATGSPTGSTCARSEVHSRGLYHRAVHIWLLCPSSREVLLQRRAAHKDSWPGLWDVSSAGHVSAGGVSLASAQRELSEELGVCVLPSRLEFVFTHLECCTSVQGGRQFVNNEFQDIYVLCVSAEERLVLDAAAATLRQHVLSEEAVAAAAGQPLTALALQASEVSAAAWLPLAELERMYRQKDPSIVPWDCGPDLERLLQALQKRADIE